MAENYDYLFKLLIIGDSGAGKSSLLMRYSGDEFPNSHLTTIGVDFKIKTLTVGGRRVKLQIWDTAGQERFRTITATYYRGAHGIIVVYEVTSRPSFENVQRWLTEARHHCNDTIGRLLVGNKADVDEHQRRVTLAEGEQFAAMHNLRFIETSALTNMNVTRLFEMITEDVLALKQASETRHNDGQGDVIKLRKGEKSEKKKKGCC